MACMSWCRVALYVPSATALVKGGFFEPCQTQADSEGGGEGEGGARQWDTPTSAQHVLLGMQEAHGAALARMPLRLDASKQLLTEQQQEQEQQEQGETPSPGGAAVEPPTTDTKQGGLAAAAAGAAVPTLGQLVTHGLAADDVGGVMPSLVMSSDLAGL